MMAISESLLNPEFTQGFALLVIGLMTMILYAAMRLYSTIVFASWAITVIIFIGVGVYGLPIMLFYFGVITSCMLIAIASIRYSQIT